MTKDGIEVMIIPVKEYKELKAEASIKQPMGVTDIIDFYGTFGGV